MTLSSLTVNRRFMSEFIAAETPCVGLGLLEEGTRRGALVALRPTRVIPRDVTERGFRFGHSVLGTSSREVVQFMFQFYGFESYNPKLAGVLR